MTKIPQTEPEIRTIDLEPVDSATPGATNLGNQSIVTKMVDLLGGPLVLLPLKDFAKYPHGQQDTGWQQRTVATMQDQDYLRRFASPDLTGVGVLLGEPSGGLCTIDLDLNDEVDSFLALNPRLRETLHTRRARGGNIWVRIIGPYPASGKIKTKDGADWGEWRAAGNQTVVYGAAIDREKGETEPTPYKILHRAKPVELSFDEIVWPEHLVLPWKKAAGGAAYDHLVEKFGEPYYEGAAGKPGTLNESFWAGLHADENILLHEPDERAFYTYDPATGLYRVESESVIRCRISERMLEGSRQMGIPAIQKKRTAGILNNIISHLRGIVEKRGAFASRRPLVHLANGVILFHDGEADFVEFSPEFYSRNASPISYDPAAACERFLNELVLPAVHPDDVALLQKFAGMFLLGDNRAQRMLILDGEAGRGKTQFANVIQGIIGHVNSTQLRTRHLDERFEIYRFLGKTLLVGVDVEPNFLGTKGAAGLKGLVGGDWFDAEQKGGTGHFQVQGNFNVLITSNARLRVRLTGDVGAWRRRINIVRFEAPPPKRKVPDFGTLLVQTEGGGVLNWMLQGCQMVLADIPPEGGDINLTERQRVVVDSLLAESDSLRHFLTDKVVPEASCDLTVQEIVEGYAQYCPEKSWKALPVIEIHDQLETLMLELFASAKAHSIKRDSGSQRGFRGVRFK